MSSLSEATLFKPLQIGDLTVQHRIALAPLTRVRADNVTKVPSVHAAEYYSQRGSVPGTLLITEGTMIHPRAGGMGPAPGIYSPAQIASWKGVVDAVHNNKSFLFMQIHTMGRAATHEFMLTEPGGPYPVVGPSEIPQDGGDIPQALTEKEIGEFLEFYAQAAINFVEKAGGDGVEVHMANGFMPNEFLSSRSNNRTDKYGGSVENRARFPLEILRTLSKAVGAKRVGFRLSPWSNFQEVKTDYADTIETYSYLVKKVKEEFPDLGYLHAVEARIDGSTESTTVTEKESLDFLHEIWTPKPFLSAGGFDQQKALEIAEKRANSIVVFGRHFISNPDLPNRIRNGVPFNPYIRATFYGGGAEGYTDYPFASQIAAKA